MSPSEQSINQHLIHLVNWWAYWIVSKSLLAYKQGSTHPIWLRNTDSLVCILKWACRLGLRLGPLHRSPPIKANNVIQVGLCWDKLFGQFLIGLIRVIRKTGIWKTSKGDISLVYVQYTVPIHTECMHFVVKNARHRAVKCLT